MDALRHRLILSRPRAGGKAAGRERSRHGHPPKSAGAFGGDAALYERDLLEDIIPMI